MKNDIQKLRIDNLTNVEFGELMSRHLAEVSTIPATTLVDAAIKAYLTGITTQVTIFKKALQQANASTETLTIEQGDKIRDAAVKAFRTAIKLAGQSDVAAEVEAARILKAVVKRYANIEDLSYDAETLTIENLIAEVTGKNAAQLTLLGLTKYITRLQIANNQFKALVLSRANSGFVKESFDTRALRNTLSAYYREFTIYVLAMANTSGTEQYLKTLTWLNNTRKEYSDKLARKQSPAKTSPDEITITPAAV